ncbi:MULTISPECIES: hypothetical protein [Streptomyces]
MPKDPYDRGFSDALEWCIVLVNTSCDDRHCVGYVLGEDPCDTCGLTPERVDELWAELQSGE